MRALLLEGVPTPQVIEDEERRISEYERQYNWNRQRPADRAMMNALEDLRTWATMDMPRRARKLQLPEKDGLVLYHDGTRLVAQTGAYGPNLILTEVNISEECAGDVARYAEWVYRFQRFLETGGIRTTKVTKTRYPSIAARRYVAAVRDDDDKYAILISRECFAIVASMRHAECTLLQRHGDVLVNLNIVTPAYVKAAGR